MFESVSERFTNLRHVKKAKLVFRAWMHYFGGTEVEKMVSQQNQPFYPIRPQTMFESVLEHFANFCTSNEAKLVFRACLHYFMVQKLRKWFRNEINHSTPLDPKRCLSVFVSISQTFSTSNEAELVFGPECTNSGVPKLRKWFRDEIDHSTPSDPKWCLRVFWRISQTFCTSNEAKLRFDPACTISGYRSCENGFATKSTILPH